MYRAQSPTKLSTLGVPVCLGAAIVRANQMQFTHVKLMLDRKASLGLAFLATVGLVLATAALWAAPGLARSAGCGGAGEAPAKLSPAQLSSATTCVINRIRRAHGLRPVHPDRSLRRAADAHSSNMVRQDFFSHYSPGGSSMQSRIGGSGYLAGARSFYYGEVIGGGIGALGSPKSVARGWMGSPPHRAAILSGRFRDLGVGAAHGFPGGGSRGATYTVDFGARN